MEVLFAIAASLLIYIRPRRYVRCLENDYPVIPSVSDVSYSVGHCNDVVAKSIISSLCRLQKAKETNVKALCVLGEGKKEAYIIVSSIILPLIAETILCCAFGGGYVFALVPASFVLAMIINAIFPRGKYKERSLQAGHIDTSYENPATLVFSMEKEESRICDFISRREEIACLREEEKEKWLFWFFVYSAISIFALVISYEM